MLGDRIRSARTKANIKQEAFADYLKLSRSSIVNIEKGRQHPSIHLLLDIAKILKTNVVDLFPVFETSEKVNPLWEKILSNQSKDKATNKIVLGFIKDINS